MTTEYKKIKHLKLFERLTIVLYKRRRYVCHCGKRFSEKNPFVDRYQRYAKEANQVMCIRSVKAKTFKEAYELKELYKEWQRNASDF